MKSALLMLVLLTATLTWGQSFDSPLDNPTPTETVTPVKPHKVENQRWLTKQTVIQLSMVGTVYAADGFSTNMSRYAWKNKEMNPFLGNNPGGLRTAGFITGGFAATVGTSYMLRNHNRIRWVATGLITATEVILIKNNIRYAHEANTNCPNNPLCTLR